MVEFVRKYRESKLAPLGECTYTYEVYRAKKAEEARKFLDSKTISKPYCFVIVETPEGNWGKDYKGIYKE